MKNLRILFLSVFFWGCTSQPKTVFVKFQAEELEVIKQTLPQDYCCKMNFFEPPLFLPKGSHITKKYKQRLKRLKDSADRAKPETQIWFLKDTLYSVSNKKYYQRARIKLDTAFFRIEKNLFSTLYPKQPVKLAGLTIGKQILKPYDSAKKSTQKQKHYAYISRVAFNLAHDKACYYWEQSFNWSDNYYWAENEIIYAEKKQGKWHLIYRKLRSIT
ncbi:MAG: hypothetical protein EOP42_05565 [Sphingobacteriaceae bacterium]|nr:MAG: hypothetical protein EOP42_05565 [Sphingobacteriaceae bacterium]